MKKFIFILILGIFCISQSLWANETSKNDFSINLGPIITATGDKTIEDKLGVEGSVGWKNLSLKLSYEPTAKHFYGQKVGKIHLYSIRIGYKAPLKKYIDGLAITFDIGYYFTDFRMRRGSGHEAIYAEMHKMADRLNGGRWHNWEPGDICCESTELDYIFWTCNYEISHNFGGTVGINYEKTWDIGNKSIGITTDVRYRYLTLTNRMTANIQGLPENEWGGLLNGLPYHSFHQEEDFSGFQFWIGLSFKF